MVRTVHVTGIASARTTAISMGAYLGPGRVGMITAARQVMNRSRALSLHAHRHTFSAHPHRHTFSAHPHRHTLSAHAIAIGSAAWLADRTLDVNAGVLQGSDATAMAGFPAYAGTIHHSNVAGTVHVSNIAGTVHHSNVAGRDLYGITMQAYTVDSMGRYVAAGTHPAANHIVLKPHGAAGARIELGNVIRNGDLLEITLMMQNESAGIF